MLSHAASIGAISGGNCCQAMTEFGEISGVRRRERRAAKMRGTGAEAILRTGSGTALPGLLLEQSKQLLRGLVGLFEHLNPGLLQHRFFRESGVG